MYMHWLSETVRKRGLWSWGGQLCVYGARIDDEKADGMRLVSGCLSVSGCVEHHMAHDAVAHDMPHDLLDWCIICYTSSASSATHAAHDLLHPNASSAAHHLLHHTHDLLHHSCIAMPYSSYTPTHTHPLIHTTRVHTNMEIWGLVDVRDSVGHRDLLVHCVLPTPMCMSYLLLSCVCPTYSYLCIVSYVVPTRALRHTHQFVMWHIEMRRATTYKTQHLCVNHAHTKGVWMSRPAGLGARFEESTHAPHHLCHRAFPPHPQPSIQTLSASPPHPPASPLPHLVRRLMKPCPVWHDSFIFVPWLSGI